MRKLWLGVAAASAMLFAAAPASAQVYLGAPDCFEIGNDAATFPDLHVAPVKTLLGFFHSSIVVTQLMRGGQSGDVAVYRDLIKAKSGPARAHRRRRVAYSPLANGKTAA